MTTRGAAKVNDMVYELYSPDKEKIKLEILFFHGLQFGDKPNPELGIYLSTWKSGNLSSQDIWPRDWLPERFPWARILAIKYDSSIITTAGEGRFDLHNATESLAKNLVLAKVGKSTSCPVIFVGHSFGGIVIKSLCLYVHDKSSSSLHQERKKMTGLLRNIKGLFFYGTPHRGMSCNVLLSMENASPLMKSVEVLSAESARLHENLENLRVKYSWHVGGVGETKATRLTWENQRPSRLQLMLIGVISCCCGSQAIRLDNYGDFYSTVVGEGSARYGEFIVVDADHISLCRPETQTSTTYTLLIDFVEQVTAVVEEPPNTPRCRNRTTYVPLPDIEASIREALVEKDVILLHGNPGSGKSTLARYIRDYYSSSPHELQGRNKVASGSSRDDTVSEPRKFSVVVIDCGREALAGPMLLELLQTLSSKASARQNYSPDQRVLIKEEIRSFLKEQETLIILDDVWEQPFIEAFVDDLAFDLHDQVKFLITSRSSTIWKSSTAIEVPPVSFEKAEQILAAHAGLADHELPSNLKGIANRLIKRTECNPLALAMAGSRITKSKNTTDKEWEAVVSSYSTTMEEKMKGKGTSPKFTPVFDSVYKENIGETLLMTYNHLSDNSRRLLIIIGNCDGKTIPHQVARRMYTKVHEGEHPTSFHDHLNQLREDGTMLQVNENSIAVFDPKLAISSSDPYAASSFDIETLGFHDLQRKFINNHNKTRDTVGVVMDSLLGTRRDGTSSVEIATDEHSGTSKEVLALCILYLRKQYAQRAAKYLEIRDPDFSLFKELRVALGPLVILLCEQLSEDEGQKHESSESEEESNQPSRREDKGEVDSDKLIYCAKQVMIELVCNGELHDDSLVTLLASLKFGPAITSVLHNLRYTKLKSTMKGRIPGTIQSLINSSHGDRSQRQEVRALHLFCLSKIAWLHGPQEIQAVPGAIEALVNSHWLDHEGGFVLSVHILSTLAAFALNCVCSTKIGEVPGAIPKLLSLIHTDNGNNALQWDLIFVLNNLTCTNEANRMQIVEHPGALEGLVTLLDGEKRSEFVAFLLGNVAIEIEGKKKIGEVPGAIPKLLSLIQKGGGNLALQEEALMRVLYILTYNNEANRKQLVEHPGAIAGLVKLLDDEKSSEFLQRLAFILSNVAIEIGEKKIGEVLCAIPKLLSLIQQERGDIALQEALMSALHNLTCKNEANLKQIVEHPGAVEGLVKLLDGEKSSEFLRTLAVILNNVATDKEGEKKIGEVPGAIPKLLSWNEKESGDTALQEVLMDALVKLTYKNEANRKQIAEHPGAVEGLVKLLDREKSSKFLRSLAGILSNVAIDIEATKKIGEITGAIPKLLAMIQKETGDIALQEKLVIALHNLTWKHEANRKQLVELPGAVEGLVKLLDGEKSSEFLQTLAVILTGVAINIDEKKRIGEIPGAIPKLLSLIQKESGDIALQEALVIALHNLTCKHEAHRKQVVEHPGAVEGLVKLLDGEKSSKFLGTLALILNNVAICIEGEKKIVEVPGAIPKLLSLIEKESGDNALQEVLVIVLHNLTCKHGANRKLIVEHPGAVEGLVKLLDGEKSSEFLGPLAFILRNVTIDIEGQKKIGEVPGAIPKFLSLVEKKSGDIALQEVLVIVLHNLTCRHEANRKQIVEHPGAVEGLVKLLDGEKSPEFLGPLAFILRNVATDREGKKKIGEIPGAIPRFLSLMEKKRGDTALQGALTNALYHLTCENEANLKQVVEHPGAVEGLVKVLDPEKSSEFLRRLAFLLRNMTIEIEGKKKIGEVPSAIPILLSLIHKESGVITSQEVLVRALYTLTCENEADRKQIVEHPGAVEGLVKLLAREKSSQFLHTLACTLCNVAIEIEGSKKIGEVPGAIPKFLSLIQKESGDVALQEALMSALSNLTSNNETNQKQIVEHPGAVEGLVKLLDGEKSSEFLERLANILSHVATQIEGKKKIGEVRGAITKVLSLVLKEDGSRELQEALMGTLQQLVMLEANRIQIMEYPDTLEGLVKLIDVGKGFRYLEELCRTIYFLAVESEGAMKLGDVSGAISKVLTLVLQDDESIPDYIKEILVLALQRLMVIKGNRRQILETSGALDDLLQLVDGRKSSRYLEGVASILASVAIDAEGTRYAGVVSRAITKLVISVLQENGSGAFEAKLVESLLCRCLI